MSLADSHFSLADRILTDFHSQVLCLAPLPSSGALGWGFWHEVKTTASQGKPLQLRYPDRISVATCGSWASSFCIFTLPTSLYLASFVNPWLQEFCSASLHLVIPVHCSIVWL